MNTGPKKTSRWTAEFKEFALRGNVVDLAVGVIIGGAFGKITTSLVNDLLMPVIGVLLGGVDFSSFNITLPALWSGHDPIVLNLGSFIGTVVDFLIIALCVFFFVKIINRLRRKNGEEPKSPPEPLPEAALLTEIRDLLRRQEEREKQ